MGGIGWIEGGKGRQRGGEVAKAREGDCLGEMKLLVGSGRERADMFLTCCLCLSLCQDVSLSGGGSDFYCPESCQGFAMLVVLMYI